jgi:excisionase family DNA binding protein
VTDSDPRRQPGDALEPLLSVDDVVRLLGVSESGIYRLVRAGDLPRVKVGNRTLFEPAAIRAFIAERREASPPSPDPRAALEAHHV